MNDFRWIVPVPYQPDAKIRDANHLTREFREEVSYRQSFEQYCNWYAASAEQNRQEHQKLQSDFNVLGWFYRR
jgi:uncharacterized protein (DUF4415 family)